MISLIERVKQCKSFIIFNKAEIESYAKEARITDVECSFQDIHEGNVIVRFLNNTPNGLKRCKFVISSASDNFNFNVQSIGILLNRASVENEGRSDD